MLTWRWRRSKDRNLIWWLTAAAVALVLHWLGALRPMENLLVRLSSPLVAVASSAADGLRSRFLQATDQRDLAAELAKVELANQRLLRENASLQYLREENRVLRKYVNLFDEAKYAYVLSRVVSRSAPEKVANENNRLIINRGAKHGLLKGLLVVDAEGIAIGKVIDVKDEFAEVALVTSPDCRLSVAKNASQKTIGVAQGESGLTIGVNFIPQTEKLEPGDVLVTSGLEPNIPAGFVVGSVSRIDKTDNEIWQAAVIEPVASLEGIKLLSILLPQNFK